MTANRLLAAVYWIAITVFLAGVALLAVAEAAHVPALEIPGEIVLVAAWGVAAVGAAVDVVRRRHTHAD